MARLIFWHEGDPSVGIDGERAVVEMEVTSDTHAQAVLDALEPAFAALWDFPVLSDVEAEDTYDEKTTEEYRQASTYNH